MQMLTGWPTVSVSFKCVATPKERENYKKDNSKKEKPLCVYTVKPRTELAHHGKFNRFKEVHIFILGLY